MIKLERIIDNYGGNILCKYLSMFKPKRYVLKRKRILFVKLWAIGESVLTLPLIEQIRQQYPKTELDVLCSKRNHQVYTNNKDINNVFIVNNLKIYFKLRNYDLVFDLEPYMNLSALFAFWLGKNSVGFSHGIRSKLYSYKIPYNSCQHIVYTYLDLISPFTKKIQKPNNLVKLKYSKSDEKVVKNFLFCNDLLDTNRIVGVCAGAAESSRGRIWQTHKFSKLCDLLIKNYNAKILLTGAQYDKKINQQILNNVAHKESVLDLAGKFTLSQFFNLVEYCSIFISNDTGPMHISAAQGIPTIGLFCPNTPVRFAPFGENNVSIYKPVLPKPCINVHLGQIPDCTDHNHMIKIDVEDVYNAAVEKLGLQ